MSPPVLEAQGITRSFAGIVALDAVSLRVEAGERVGLIGPNGAGKTTFFNCVLGMLRPDRGTVRLDGEDVSRLAVHARARRGIGRSFQRIELFPESTVRDHLLIAERARRGDGRLWRDLLGLGRPAPTSWRRATRCWRCSASATWPASRSSTSASARGAWSRWGGR